MQEQPDYSARLTRAQQLLSEASCWSAVIAPSATMRYLTGWAEDPHERVLVLVLPADDEPLFVVPAMYAESAAANPAAITRVLDWNDAEGGVAALARFFSGTLSERIRDRERTRRRSGLMFVAAPMHPPDEYIGGLRVAVDDEWRAGHLMALGALLDRFEFAPLSDVLGPLRLRKDAAELTALRAAARTTDAATPAILAALRPGVTETEVAEEVIRAHRAVDRTAKVYGAIIASGPNGARPHHQTGDRHLERGDVVVLDYGAFKDDYCSDITRTVSIGPPADAEAARVYRIVYEAQQRALAAIRPGVPCREADRAARSVIEGAGYGPSFLHRTGHGLGLQVHEAPDIVAGNAQPLEEGMVFSVEPGIYLPGRFGVRLEVIVAVTSDGVEVLNELSPPELPELPT